MYKRQAQVVETTDRAAVAALCKLDKYVDVMIPRGGESLVRAVCEAATMPVLKHYMGVCHLYIDAVSYTHLDVYKRQGKHGDTIVQIFEKGTLGDQVFQIRRR